MTSTLETTEKDPDTVWAITENECERDENNRRVLLKTTEISKLKDIRFNVFNDFALNGPVASVVFEGDERYVRVPLTEYMAQCIVSSSIQIMCYVADNHGLISGNEAARDENGYRVED